MATIVFKGWEIGMKKISFIDLLRDEAKISLKAAKDIKDKIVDNNEIVELEIPDDKTANKIIFEARKLGINCELGGNLSNDSRL